MQENITRNPNLTRNLSILCVYVLLLLTSTIYIVYIFLMVWQHVSLERYQHNKLYVDIAIEAIVDLRYRCSTFGNGYFDDVDIPMLHCIHIRLLFA